MTLIWTLPSTTNASAMTYWRPCRKPLVPSIGSRVQHREQRPEPPSPIHATTRSIVASVNDLTNDLHNLPGEIRIGAQQPRVFLGDQGILWKCLSEPRSDDGLNREVGNCDR